MTYTQNKSKKLWKNKNMCHLYIYIYIYSNSAPSLLQFPISAMPLPKSNNIFFIFLIFRQCHCHKPIATIFFSSYFDNAIATNSFLQFFPLYFGNAIATNQLQQFFFPSISAMPLPQIHSHNFSPSISAMPLPQTNYNNFFSLLFRQCHCHKFIPTFFFPLYFGNGIVTNQL